MPSRGRKIPAIFIAAAVVATAALGIVSLGKWSDAIVDTGTEWIYADALARGEVLYRDVVYWFGPFTPYFQAAFVRLFGSSFRSLALCGAAGAVAVLAALFFALRRVTGAWPATLWTALAVPALVFMPNSGGAILGMGYRIWHPAGFALLACLTACLPGGRGQISRSLAAGIAAGLAGLCRTEWGLITLFSVLLAAWLRDRRRADFGKEALGISAAAAVTFASVLGAFALVAGPRALVADAPVLLVGIPPETPAGFLLAGLKGWPSGIGVLFYSFAVWAGLVALAAAVSARRTGSERARTWLARLFALLVIIAVLAAGGAASSGAVLFSAAPLVCFSSLWSGLRKGSGPRAAALAGFGCLGLLASHRRLFHIADSGYVAPPLLFALVCAAGLLQLAVAGEKERAFRIRFQGLLAGGLAALVGLAFLGRAFQYLSDPRVPVPGTGGMLSASSETARSLSDLADRMRSGPGAEEGLVVIPEGGVLNFLTGRRNPMRHKISIPGYLGPGNEEEFLRDLRRAAPSDVVVWKRFAGEYGRGFFGEGYGRRTLDWIAAHSAGREAVPGAEVFTLARRQGS